jgi:hypothetical protein
MMGTKLPFYISIAGGARADTLDCAVGAKKVKKMGAGGGGVVKWGISEVGNWRSVEVGWVMGDV